MKNKNENAIDRRFNSNQQVEKTCDKPTYDYLVKESQIAIENQDQEYFMYIQTQLFEKYNFVPAAFNLAIMSISQGKYAESIMYLEFVIVKGKPDHMFFSSLYMYLKALELLKSEKLEKALTTAIQTCESFIQLDEKYAGVVVYLSDFYLMNGNRDKYEECMKKQAELVEQP